MTERAYGRLALAVVLLCSEPGRTQDGEFPIGAWWPGLLGGTESAQWATRLDAVEDADFNTIHASLQGSQPPTVNQAWMREAHARGLRVQLLGWEVPEGWRDESKRFWAQTWQAESNHFTQATGTLLPSEGRYAEKGTHDKNKLLLDTPSTGPGFWLRSSKKAKPGKQQYTRHVFWLKTDNTTGQASLATLTVLDHATGKPLVSRPVFPRQLAPANVYKGVPVTYVIPRGGLKVRYQVEWTGEGNLWVDEVRASDLRGMQLFGGDFDMAIKTTLDGYYNGVVDPRRYSGNFWAACSYDWVTGSRRSRRSFAREDQPVAGHDAGGGGGGDGATGRGPGGDAGRPSPLCPGAMSRLRGSRRRALRAMCARPVGGLCCPIRLPEVPGKPGSSEDARAGLTSDTAPGGQESFLMRVRNVLWSIIALAAVDGAEVAAVDPGAFVVDGDPREWGGFDIDRSRDVIPDTNSTVDIRTYGFVGDDFPKGGEMNVFILKFLAPPFQGPEETRVEWFFDVSPDTSHGEIKAPWKMFRPDYRFAIVGKNGGITKEVYGRYADGRWVFTEGADIPHLESAVFGQWLEGAILNDVAFPPEPPLPPEGAMVNSKAALEVSKGPFREYIPDDAWYNPWHPFGGYGWATVIEPESWGRLKGR